MIVRLVGARRYAIAGSLLVVLLLLSLGAGFFWQAPTNKSHEPFFSGLGDHVRKISTRSALAQRYFNQGLAFLYGFNSEAALRSFKAAADNDPQCAMAYWGIAMANGPNINDLMRLNFNRAKAATEAAAKAAELARGATPVERALVDAVGKRYAYPPSADRSPLDAAYADAMRRVWKAFPDDADVGALTADALLDLRPWDQWKRDGTPQPGTEELLQTLDDVLAKSPRHPYALHLLIHAVEDSPHPEKGDRAADILRDLAPGLEHLLHMPTHIDIRRGRWYEAVVASDKAVAAEFAYRRMIPVPPHRFYGFSLMHDDHMRSYAATMLGQSAKAMHSLRELIDDIPPAGFQQQPALFDGLLAMPYEIHLRFGDWDGMLAEPEPDVVFPISRAMRHYGRAVAFAAKRQIAPAKAEQSAFLFARKAVPPNALFIRLPGAHDLLNIAEKMMAGEILYREGKVDEAVAALREAIQVEDKLRFDDPPMWFLPVRHALGATLMDAGRYAEAEAVYREDLKHNLENGWALYGLSRALRMQKKTAEASAVTARFEKAWQHADVKLSSSCFCLQGKD